MLEDQCAANSTQCAAKNNFTECCIKDPQLYYFYRTALGIAPDIEATGGTFNGKMFGCLCLAWVVVFACIVKGVKSSGKVSVRKFLITKELKHIHRYHSQPFPISTHINKS